MSVLPKYHRVFLSLRDQIVNGVYDLSSPMPSENQLCSEFDVSRATIRHALELLEEEGLIERRQGAPTYPRAVGYKDSQQRRNLDLLGRAQNHEDLFPGEVQHHYEVVSLDKKLRRQFSGEDKLGRVVRVRWADEKPYCFVVTFLPLAIADKIVWADLGDTPVITAAAEAGFPFAKVEQVITATVADEESAAAMQAPVGSPLLCVSGLFLDSDDQPVMRKDGYFHPDSFEYRMTLHNKGGTVPS